jgi:hypothetical protein
MDVSRMCKSGCGGLTERPFCAQSSSRRESPTHNVVRQSHPQFFRPRTAPPGGFSDVVCEHDAHATASRDFGTLGAVTVPVCSSA